MNMQRRIPGPPGARGSREEKACSAASVVGPTAQRAGRHGNEGIAAPPCVSRPLAVASLSERQTRDRGDEKEAAVVCN
jgi:hypothetical protein